ncbi:MAG: hypothetical protein RLY86_1230 [Pseudomonadota bacterium]|jgi:uncharacterized protein (DUF1778 family)
MAPVSTARATAPRDKRIQVLVNPREQQVITERARNAGMDVGPYLRSLALGSAGVDPGEAETIKLVQDALQRMTTRLEQTADRVKDALARINAVERRQP